MSAASRGVTPGAAAGAPLVAGAEADAIAAISASLGARYSRRARIAFPFSLTLIFRISPLNFVFVV